MPYERRKVAPWETIVDGEWHVVRIGPDAEGKDDSMRAYRSYKMSARDWARRNGLRAQLSRRENGRIVNVRFTPSQDPPPKTEAVRLLEYALHLRMYGERAPGGTETWAEFDRRCEAYLRKVTQ